MWNTEETFHTRKASIKFAVRGQLLPENRRLVFHPLIQHTWVLFAALASISILLQHCLEHGKMVGIVSVGSLRGRNTPEKPVTHKTPRHLCSRVEVIHWHQTVHFYSWNSATFTAPHCSMDKSKNVSLKRNCWEKWCVFPHFLLLSWHLPGIFPTAFPVRKVISGGMHGKNAPMCKQKDKLVFLSLIKVLNLSDCLVANSELLMVPYLAATQKGISGYYGVAFKGKTNAFNQIRVCLWRKGTELTRLWITGSSVLPLWERLSIHLFSS